MGLLLSPQKVQFQINMTMRLQVMSSQTKTDPESMLCNGDAEESSIPVVSIIKFEDVDTLKSKVKSRTAVMLSELGEHGGNECRSVKNINSSEFSVLDHSKGSHEHMSEEKVAKLKEFPQDDADAALSVSSDTTLELESTDSKTQENKNSLLRLKNQRKETGTPASSSESTIRGHKEHSQRNVMPFPFFTDDLPVEVGGSARFSKVLENISLPLLYIPTTKQLVKSSGDQDSEREVLYQKDPHSLQRDNNLLYMPERDYSCNGSESASSTLDLSSCELLGPNSSMHEAHNTQEFHFMSRYTESDRLTLHSMDSYPGYHISNEQSSYLFADNSSLSNVSTGTDFSVSAVSAGEDYNAESQSLSLDAADEALFMDINLHSRNSYDKGYNSSSLDSGYGDKRAPNFEAAKKKSFTGLNPADLYKMLPVSNFPGIHSHGTSASHVDVSGNFFTKRVKEESPPGWKLFGRIPPKPTSHRNAQEITSEFQARQRKVEKPHFPSANKKQGLEVMSTTALILENRPKNLPTKNPEEAEKHRQLYEEMVAEAKKKEQKDIKLKKKQLQLRRKLEDQMMAAACMWDTEILPSWETMKTCKKARDLWWMGLPPNVRGRVWQLAIGNDLNITHALYDICHERAEERIKFVQEESSLVNLASEGAASQHEPSNKESSVKVIKLDVSRTFPHLCIFQKGGPFYDLLHNLLGAYACYRPDVGYVQGMSFIAAILLLNMDVADAFVCFANLLNRPCQLAFFRMDESVMTAYYRTFEEFFKENLPKMYAHFSAQSVTPNLYLMEWVFLLYSKSLPLDVACRVWDVFFRDGEEFLFRTAIGILKLYESVLLKMDFIHIAQFLTKLPEDISADQLFKEVDSVKMHIDKRGFHTVHIFFKDLHASSS